MLVKKPQNSHCIEQMEQSCVDYPDKCHACFAYREPQKESPVSAWPWMLITVQDREIATEQFKTYEEAFAQMLNELEKEFDKGDYDQAWDEIKALGKKVATSDFEFSPYSAWSNVDENCYCDWKIVSIE